jgi:hypothetical protein
MLSDIILRSLDGGASGWQNGQLWCVGPLPSDPCFISVQSVAQSFIVHLASLDLDLALPGEFLKNRTFSAVFPRFLRFLPSFARQRPGGGLFRGADFRGEIASCRILSQFVRGKCFFRRLARARAGRGKTDSAARGIRPTAISGNVNTSTQEIAIIVPIARNPPAPALLNLKVNFICRHEGFFPANDAGVGHTVPRFQSNFRLL